METSEIIKKCVSDYKSSKAKFNTKKEQYLKAEKTFSASNKKYLNVFTNILKVMGSVEDLILKEVKEDSKFNGLRSSYESYYRWFNFKIQSIKYNEDGIWIKYSRFKDLYEGDHTKYFYKTFIPYAYFEMTNDEIRDIHKEWSRKKVNTIIERRKSKQEQEQLDKELKQYQELKKKFENTNI